MTDKTHPITPPPERFKQWEDDILNERDNVDHVLDCAWKDGFRAGADAELEACVEWLKDKEWIHPEFSDDLRAARRPKPPSLAEQSLAQTNAILTDPSRVLLIEVRETLELNRRALERLQELESNG